ncbi:MAG: helix-turn-helix transcriptional regulator [Rhodobacteraceae bacterium]|jgi:DNA-binding HxlR family transcriptional regulator|uniref:winged helix-turn-helix transcriptional regulator n=1 Tax=Marivita sp. TaxID=2003365 RepID=UPI003B52822F|nr:helix-turn-helix transcriptional regulator [Paracoccaceae bacterium]
MKDGAQMAGPWADPVTGECPVADTLRCLGGKHGAKILHCLIAGELHFLELHRAMHGVSRKVLRDQLREFEERGLVARTPKHDARQRVGYALTLKGSALGDILGQLYDWQQTFG